MSKGNFILSDDWQSLFASLPDDKAGQLIKATFAYHTGEGDVEVDDPILSAVFAMIKAKIDENDRKYAEVCEKRRAAASSKGSTSKHKQANASKCTQEAYDNENDNEDDNNLKVIKNNNKGPKRYFDDDRLNARYHDYLRSRKAFKSETGRKANAEKLERMATDVSGVLDVDKAVAILDQSIENGWQGLFPLKGSTSSPYMDSIRDRVSVVDSWL